MERRIATGLLPAEIPRRLIHPLGLAVGARYVRLRSSFWDFSYTIGNRK